MSQSDLLPPMTARLFHQYHWVSPSRQMEIENRMRKMFRNQINDELDNLPEIDDILCKWECENLLTGITPLDIPQCSGRS
jgi:hypothetical protein